MKGLKNKIYLFFVLPVVTGILLSVSALPSNVWFLNFIAFLPLLFAGNMAISQKKPFLIFTLQLIISLLVFFIWVGSWILQTAHMGFLIGILIIVPFVLFVSPYILFLKRGNKYAPVYFVAAWLVAEMLQSYFQLGTPFYNLGHSVAKNPALIQWYEYTGASGGTLWVLVVNFLLYSLGKGLLNKSKSLKRNIGLAVTVVLLPMLISILIFNTYKEKGMTSEVLILHPSTDCFDEKYKSDIYKLMDNYLETILPQLSNNTEYVVLPETAVTNGGWVAEFNRNLVFNHFHKQTANLPNLKLITGAVVYEAISNVEKIKGYEEIPGIRFSKNYKKWYYTYNSALQIEKNHPVQMRAKEGLVPYQEYTPYPRILPHIAPVGIDFQFSTRENNQQVFTAQNQKKIAAMICYEAVFGNKFRKAADEGAGAFFVLFNEGWYFDVPKVPQQFLQLSFIRAIENRRSIAHSSNMGISAFINQRGELIAKTNSKQPDFLLQNIRMNKGQTLYTKLGNYLGIMAFVVFVLLAFMEIKNKQI